MKKSIFIIIVLFSIQAVQSQTNTVGKIYFSKEPFGNINTGSTSAFTSSDFIYGRLETTNGKLLNELLEVPPTEKNKMFPSWYLYYIVRVYKDGKMMSYENSRTEWYLTNIKWDINYLNFDVLPSIQSVSTALLAPMRPQDVTGAPLYGMMDKYHFPDNGTYTIKVEIYDQTLDDWGTLDPSNKWPRFSGEFNFTFNTGDIAKLNQNARAINVAIGEKIKNEKDKAFWAERNKKEQEKIDAMEMPEGWTAKSYPIGGGYTLTQIKNYFLGATSNKTIVKIWAGSNDGWQVEKNALGIPLNQFLDQSVHVFFKDTQNRCGSQRIVLKKKYLGGGRYGDILIGLISETWLPCSKMK